MKWCRTVFQSMIDSVTDCRQVFNNFRADRNFKTSVKVRGGGVLILVRKELNASVALVGQSVESIYIRIKFNNLDLIVGGVYIPPASDLSVYEDFCSDLELLFDLTPDLSYIIARKLNLPNVPWHSCGDLNVSNDFFNVINHTCSQTN